MSQISFDKPYPATQEQLPWTTAAMHGLLRVFAQKINSTRHHKEASRIRRVRSRSSRSSSLSSYLLVAPASASGSSQHTVDVNETSSNRSSSKTSISSCRDSISIISKGTGLEAAEQPSIHHEQTSSRTCDTHFDANFPAPYTLDNPTTLSIFLADDTVTDQRTPLRRKKGVPNLKSPSFQRPLPSQISGNPMASNSAVSTPKASHPLLDFLDGNTNIDSLAHFETFFIVKPTPQGDRVLYTSDNLWRGEDFGMEDLFLHNERTPGQASNIITEVDEDENEISRLMLFGGLPSIGGHNGLLLVSAVDVTDFLDALTINDLEIEILMRQIHSRKSSRGGRTSENEARTVASSVDGEISDLMQRLLKEATKQILALYRDYFILSQSAKQPSFYEISHVSPNLYAAGEYVAVHLTHTPQAVMRQMGEMMSRGKRFSIEVKWGNSGRDQRLYCIPMLNLNSRRWLCILVDPNHPPLWKETHA
ncbi:hypothetical protein FQN53_006385 [Emmonsiellopsis sp. PD_33]|nr:hypothetical protein FQN53_006385 [Emmonsiellopsis sp. PD_33]